MWLQPTFTPDLKMLGLVLGLGSGIAGCNQPLPWNRGLHKSQLVGVVQQQQPSQAALGGAAYWDELAQRHRWGQWQWTANRQEATEAMEAAGVKGTGKGGGEVREDFDRWQASASANQKQLPAFTAVYALQQLPDGMHLRIQSGNSLLEQMAEMGAALQGRQPAEVRQQLDEQHGVPNRQGHRSKLTGAEVRKLCRTADEWLPTCLGARCSPGSLQLCKRLWQQLDWLLRALAATQPSTEQVVEFRSRAAALGQLLLDHFGTAGQMAEEAAAARRQPIAAAAAAPTAAAAPAASGQKRSGGEPAEEPPAKAGRTQAAEQRPQRAAAATAAAKIKEGAAAEAEAAEPPPPAIQKQQQRRQGQPAQPLVRWTPYLGILVNSIWFFQELYGGLGLLSAEPFEAANAASKDTQLHHIRKGGPDTSTTAMQRQALLTNPEAQEAVVSKQRPVKQYTQR